MRWWIGAVTLLVACGGDDEGTESRLDDILALSGDTATGQTSYDSNCVVCHGLSGEGGIGPNVQGFDLAPCISAMIDAPDGMTTFDHLDDQEIADIAAYVETL